MTERQAMKEVQRQAILFEDKCGGGAETALVKLEVFIEQWFTEYASIKLKEQTIHGYRSACKRVIPELGHMRIGDITMRDVQRFVGTLVNDKLSPKTITNVVGFMSSVFTYAQRVGIIETNPCKGVALPANNSTCREMFTQEEAQQFLDLLLSEMDDSAFQYTVCFILAIYTGFRRGELLGLEWRDFNDGLVSVRRAAYRTTERGHYTDTLKTKASKQTQKLPDSVWRLLLDYRKYQADYANSLGDKWVDTGRVFTAWNGGPIDCHAPLRYLSRFCKSHGLRRVTLHSFRHLYASLLINAGLDVKTVQASLRHSSATTTLDIYAHEFQTAQARASAAVSDALNIRIERVFSADSDNDQIMTK
jgi:integrase